MALAQLTPPTMALHYSCHRPTAPNPVTAIAKRWRGRERAQITTVIAKRVQVRRALIYIEQSVELALNKFVFEPNVAQTWVTVISMIGSFLRGVWQAGGLMGASPAEAFSVQCGLGSTMTADDILARRMIVQIKLQMVRPAEFMVLTFQQQMQGSG